MKFCGWLHLRATPLATAVAAALALPAHANVTISGIVVPGNTSGEFGNPADQVNPFIAAFTTSNTGTVSFTVTATGLVHDDGFNIGPNGIPFNFAAVGLQSPLQEAGKNGNPDPNLDSLIGAFVPQATVNTAGFKAIDNTKAGVTVGISPTDLFLIGASDTFTETGPGTLFLGINDDIVVDNFGRHVADVTGPAIPEPSTWAMLLLGFAGLGYAAFRRSAKIAAL